MRSASFQNNYEKVFKRSKAVIRRKRFELISEDADNGILTAKRIGGIFKPSYIMEVNVNKIDDTSTNVIVKIESKKHWYKTPEIKIKSMEGRFIAMLS
jgi:hypothetical protein